MFHVYTDGSFDNSNSKQGSCAFVVLKDNQLVYENVESHSNTTNNRMEYQASINSLKWLSDNYGSCEYILYSDSELLVNTANKWSFSWKKRGWKRSGGEIKNIDLVQKIHSLYLFHKGSFKWVEGHNGNKWNEYCDELCSKSDLAIKYPEIYGENK